MRTTLILLTFLNLFLFISCNNSNCNTCEKRSLAFIFDTTGSMGDDLKVFKEGADIIMDTFAANPNSPVYDYVFVPFNDPEFGPATVTRDEDAFRELLQSITVNGGGDCPEMCFSGLDLGLRYSLPYSEIYVMTDASEKDSHLLTQLITLIQRKKSHIWFLVRGDCGTNTLNNYIKVAEASSGQMFYLRNSSEILEVMKHINKTSDDTRTELTYLVNPAGYNKLLEVAIDISIESLLVMVSGGKPKIEVLNSSGEVINDIDIVENTLNLQSIQAVEIKKVISGKMTLRYGSDAQHTLKVTGVTNIKIEYGFSTSDATTIGESTNWPLAGVENSILVAVTEGMENVRTLTRCEIVTSAGNVLHNLPLTVAGRSGNVSVYKTQKINLPSNLFFIITYGTDTHGNILKRTSNTAIQSEQPDAPYITMDEQITVKEREKMVLNCKVDSLIPITVDWKRESENDTLLIANMNFTQSGEAKYEVNNVDKSYEGLYECTATNSKGFDMKTINVTIAGHSSSLSPQTVVIFSLLSVLYFLK